MRYKGLSQKEVNKRQKKFGKNKLYTFQKDSIFKIFLRQFNNFFAYLLFLASLISFLIGQVKDAFLILTILLLNAFFSFFQELKADESLEKLEKIVEAKAKVIREGVQILLDVEEIVPDDIVFLEAGDRIPADGVILEAESLEIDESVLTGESMPVSKKKGDKVFMGTTVLNGYAYVRITAIGRDAKFGSIAKTLSSVEKGESPLGNKIKDLSYKIGVLGLLLAFLTLVFDLFVRGQQFFDSLLFSVSLAVAVVPEGFPLVLATILALSVRKLSQKKVVIRRLGSIENIGNITLIATDKTGTLTENKLALRSVFGSNLKEKKRFSDSEVLILAMLFCNTAEVSTVKGRLVSSGDPLEIALIKFLHNKGIIREKLEKEWVYRKIIPFNSRDKKMSVSLYNRKENFEIFLSKGAPEVIIKDCKWFYDKGKKLLLSQELKEKILARVKEEMSKGYKVLAFSEGGDETVFLGFSTFYDPPRKSVEKALKRAKELGIKTVMITGDSKETALSVGKEIGLLEEGDLCFNSDEFFSLSSEEMEKVLPKIRIFSRVDPVAKQKIVALYKLKGEIVAVTGDGVNDAIALKSANVGIAMGSGTDVSKGAADMVILDDNYATIIRGIEEGRKIIWVLNRSIKFLVSCNFLELIVILGFLFFLNLKLFSPAQILFINLVTDSFPAFGFVFFNIRKSLLQNRINRKTFLKNSDLRDIALISLLGGSLSLILYLFLKAYNTLILSSLFFLAIVILQMAVFVYLNIEVSDLKQVVKNRFFWLFLIIPMIIQLLVIKTPFGRFLDVYNLNLSLIALVFFFGFIFLLVLIFVHSFIEKIRAMK